MIQVFIWLTALTVVVVTGAILAIQFILGRRTHRTVLASSCVLAAIYCLLGADGLFIAGTRLNRDWILLLNVGVVALTSAALVVQLWACRWLSQDQRWPWRQAGVAALLLCQLTIAGWTGWRFQHALAVAAGVAIEGGVGMEAVPGESLLTDKGRLVPVFRARIVGNPSGYSEYSEGLFSDHRIMSGPVDSQSNCHGWVFTGGHHLLMGRGVEMILADNGYQIVEKPQAGDVIIYRDIMNQIIHTGLVRAAFDDDLVLIESKWGVDGRYVHRPEDQYYSQLFKYYRSPRAPAGLARAADGAPSVDPRHLVQTVTVLPGDIVAQRPEGAIATRQHPADPMVDMYGEPLPMGESYPIGAE